MVKQSNILTVSRIVALLAVAAVLLAAALGVDSALAKGRNGKGSGNGGTTTAATLAIAPNPVAAGQVFTVSGSGFAPNKVVVVTVTGAWGDVVTADGTGAFSYRRSLTIPWTYTFDARQETSPNKWVIKASTTLTVVAP